MTDSEIGGWKVVRPLGKGGNGAVFEAHRGEGRGAIKVFHASLIRQHRGRRFLHELEAMERCRDVPGVLPIIDRSLEGDERLWFVMPLAESDRAWRHGIRTVRDAVRLCAHVGETLATLHDMGVAHRDLKPENILKLDARWVLGDLGLAHYPGKEELTKTGEAVGPRGYIAPEMEEAKEVSDPRPADVWSLAKVLWTLATGQNKPLPGWQSMSDAAARLSGSVQTADPRASRLDPLIDRATRINPNERLSMKEFVEQLRVWLGPGPFRAAPEARGVEEASSYVRDFIRDAQKRADDERDARKRAEELHAQYHAQNQERRHRLDALIKTVLDQIRTKLRDRFGQEPTGPAPDTIASPFFQLSTGQNALMLKWAIRLDDKSLQATITYKWSIRPPLIPPGMPQVSVQDRIRSEGKELLSDSTTFLCGGPSEEPALAQFLADSLQVVDRQIEEIAQMIGQVSAISCTDQS